MDKNIIKFKHLLEYFVAHLEFGNKNKNNLEAVEIEAGRGYGTYIKDLIETNNFKFSGQGNDGDIQKQISAWEDCFLNNKKVSINIFAKNDYRSEGSYLHWKCTNGDNLHIYTEWGEKDITSLSLNYYNDNSTKNTFETYSINDLDLFNGTENYNETLKKFYKRFLSEIEKDMNMKNENIKKFKNLLEYFVAHQEFGKKNSKKNVKNEIIETTTRGYNKYIEPLLLENGKIKYNSNNKDLEFSFDGDGKNDKIQNQISSWDDCFEKIKILIRLNAWGNFSPMNCYLYYFNKDTLGIHTNWDEGQIQALTLNHHGNEVVSHTLSALGLFDSKDYNKTLKDFYDLFLSKINQKKPKKNEMNNHIINLLKNKNQIILQGPPGTGKTRLAKMIAKEMTDEDKGIYKVVQFHPSYTYDDFVRGITVSNDENHNLVYKTENKVLAQMAKEAQENDAKNYILIIDEINRANLSSVLGELIYALEYRGEPVESMYSIDEDREITLPPNFYIIGTMNTADRSVGTIDYAIRRRFSFVDVLPQYLDPEGLDGKHFADTLFSKVEQLFKDGKENASTLSEEYDWKDVQLGHSYFIYTDEESLQLRIDYEIKPILMEYIKDGILKSEAIKIIEQLNNAEMLVENIHEDENTGHDQD